MRRETLFDLVVIAAIIIILMLDGCASSKPDSDGYIVEKVIQRGSCGENAKCVCMHPWGWDYSPIAGKPRESVRWCNNCGQRELVRRP